MFLFNQILKTSYNIINTRVKIHTLGGMGSWNVFWYPSDGGIMTRRIPPTFIDLSAVSIPDMTYISPDRKKNTLHYLIINSVKDGNYLHVIEQATVRFKSTTVAYKTTDFHPWKMRLSSINILFILLLGIRISNTHYHTQTQKYEVMEWGKRNKQEIFNPVKYSEGHLRSRSMPIIFP